MASHPLTLGQLSLWRDIEHLPSHQQWEANLNLIWEVPEGHDNARIGQALEALTDRHESLRTIYLLSNPDDLRQQVTSTRSPWQGSVSHVDLARFSAAELRRPFDLSRDLPWRAWTIEEEDGSVCRVLIVVNHIAADGAALSIMHSDLQALLNGAQLAEAPSPRELALLQRSERYRDRLAAAEDYWARTLKAAPRQAIPLQPGAIVRATMHTGIPLAMASRAARRHKVTLSSLMLAAYCRAFGDPAQLVHVLSANRLDPSVRDLVTSMTQWAPIVTVDAAELAFRSINQKAMTAMAHGCYDPDVVVRLRHAENTTPGSHFTFMPPPPGEIPTSPQLEDGRIEWHDPLRTSGSSCYLIARAHPTVQLTLRVMREGFTAKSLEHSLTTMRDILVQAVAEEAR